MPTVKFHWKALNSHLRIPASSSGTSYKRPFLLESDVLSFFFPDEVFFPHTSFPRSWISPDTLPPGITALKITGRWGVCPNRCCRTPRVPLECKFLRIYCVPTSDTELSIVSIGISLLADNWYPSSSTFASSNRNPSDSRDNA